MPARSCRPAWVGYWIRGREHAMSQSQSPDELEQMLPFQVNGTLSREQEARLELLLELHPEARRDLAFMHEVAAAMCLEHHHYDEQSTLAALLARIQPDPQAEGTPRQAGRRSHQWIDRL